MLRACACGVTVFGHKVELNLDVRLCQGVPVAVEGLVHLPGCNQSGVTIRLRATLHSSLCKIPIKDREGTKRLHRQAMRHETTP